MGQTLECLPFFFTNKQCKESNAQLKLLKEMYIWRVNEDLQLHDLNVPQGWQFGPPPPTQTSNTTNILSGRQKHLIELHHSCVLSSQVISWVMITYCRKYLFKVSYTLNFMKSVVTLIITSLHKNIYLFNYELNTFYQQLYWY